jgi:CheY-like chemotaxis protein
LLVPVSNGSRRILVVDDENDVRMVIQMTLRQMSYDVLAVSNATAAIASCLDARQQLDAVLLDLKMPHLDGWECRRELLWIRPTVPVILMSGFAPTPPPGEVSTRTDDVFLTRPLGRKALLEALEWVVQGAAETVTSSGRTVSPS